MNITPDDNTREDEFIADGLSSSRGSLSITPDKNIGTASSLQREIENEQIEGGQIERIKKEEVQNNLTTQPESSPFESIDTVMAFLSARISAQKSSLKSSLKESAESLIADIFSLPVTSYEVHIPKIDSVNNDMKLPLYQAVTIWHTDSDHKHYSFYLEDLRSGKNVMLVTSKRVDSGACEIKFYRDKKEQSSQTEITGESIYTQIGDLHQNSRPDE